MMGVCTMQIRGEDSDGKSWSVHSEFEFLILLLKFCQL